VTVADIAYAARSADRPRYYANDHSRDTVVIDLHPMTLIDGRQAETRLDTEGFALVAHSSAVSDFTKSDDVAAKHNDEIVALLRAQTGAHIVIVTAPGILRFSERSRLAGTLNNSMPARFAHVDVTTGTAEAFGERSRPEGARIARFAQYNIWRAISDPPQDVPLAVCDARSVEPEDLIVADAIFDEPGQPEWSFDGWVVAHNPAHRWHWFADMTRDEALIFKTHDSDPSRARCVPHVAFDDPGCAADAPPRASIEMRAIAYWFE
jgi:hypothetical protein